MVARAGIEPATFRFSGGLNQAVLPYALVTTGLTSLTGPARRVVSEDLAH